MTSQIQRRLWWPSLIAIVSIVAGARPFVDGPPPGFTGGFGQPTCSQCHFEAAGPDREGSLNVEGIPVAYEPGKSYTLTVRLRRPGMRRGGFQMTLRFADGSQAGTLQATDEGVTVTSDDGIAYGHHTRSGSVADSAGEIVWVLRWAAPKSSNLPLVVHAAGNAANDDDSAFGDHIYLFTSESSSH